MSRRKYKGFDEFFSYLIMKCSNDKKICFVEDNNMTGIYQRLFLKIFPNKNIEIIPAIKIIDFIEELKTGGKDTLEFIHQNMLKTPARKKAKVDYLILLDPDFQLIYNEPEMLKGDNVYYLKMYCIENYFIDKKCIKLAIQIHYENLQLEELEKLIEFEKWSNLVLDNLIELCGLFAFNYLYAVRNGQSLITKSEISMKNFNYFFKTKEFELDLVKINEYRDLLTKKLAKLNGDTITSFLNDFKLKIKDDPLKFLHGKYLFHSLYNYIRYKDNIKQVTKDKRVFRNLIFGVLIDNKVDELFNYLRISS